MSPDELQNHLVIAGLDSRVRGTEVQMHVCTECGNDRWNLELNVSKGVWHCWACGAGGRLDAYLTRLRVGDFHIPVRPDVVRKAQTAAPLPTFENVSAAELWSARTYLARRGIDVPTIERYGLRVCKQEKHPLYLRIVIPIRDFWTGDLLGWMGRDYIGEWPKYITTTETKIVTGWRHHVTAPVVLIEGFFDGIAVNRAECSAAVMSGTDADDVDEFAARLPVDIPLCVMLDGDAQDKAHRLTARISAFREVKSICLPSHLDPASLHPTALRLLIKKTLDVNGTSC